MTTVAALAATAALYAVVFWALGRLPSRPSPEMRKATNSENAAMARARTVLKKP